MNQTAAQVGGASAGPEAAGARAGSLRRWAWLGVRVGLTGALLAWLLWKVDFAQMRGLAAGADWWALAAAMAIFLVRNVFGGLRWRALLASEGRPAGVWLLTRIYFIGWFYGMFLPSQAGGDLARGLYLTRHDRGPLDSTVFSILIERLMGVVAIVTMGLVGLLFAWDAVPAVGRWMMLGIGAGFVGACVFLLYLPYESVVERFGRRVAPGLAAKAAKFLGAAKRFNSPRLLAVVLGHSYLFQITSIVSTYLLGVALGTDLGFGTFLVLVPLVWLSGMVPISINGFGVREAAFVMLFTHAGMDREMATATALLMSALVVVQAGVGGLMVLMPDGRKAAAAPR